MCIFKDAPQTLLRQSLFFLVIQLEFMKTILLVIADELHMIAHSLYMIAKKTKNPAIQTMSSLYQIIVVNGLDALKIICLNLLTKYFPVMSSCKKRVWVWIIISNLYKSIFVLNILQFPIDVQTFFL